jgi:hypothetical protein
MGRAMLSDPIPSLPNVHAARFRRSRPASVEELQARIAALVACRQELRAAGAGDEALERNRRRLARTQWELSLALIERYLPRAA